MSRTERLARIADILTSTRITSQEQLRNLLSNEGSDVTQATLSRDLELMHAAKGADGRYRVADLATGVPVTRDAVRLARALSELCASIESSGNIVVLRTPPGAAAYLASSIDRGGLAGAIGTIAGDDTVLVVAASADGGVELAERIELMRQGKADHR